jgi:hypothetical protein
VPWIAEVRNSRYGFGSSFHGYRALTPRFATVRLVPFFRRVVLVEERFVLLALPFFFVFFVAIR